MTAFDDRKTAAEAKFAHDQEFQFKTIARRNMLLGPVGSGANGHFRRGCRSLRQAGRDRRF